MSNKEYKFWNGISINDSQIITGITDDSGLTNQSYVLPTANAVKGYTDNKISVESSIRESQALSIASSISGIVSIETSQRVSADSSLTTSISTETSQRTSVDTSLTTSLSNEISRSISVDTSLSTSISTEYSQRVSADSSLTTSLSNEISISNSLHTLLNNNISTEESLRISSDSSLSTSIITKLSISGGTVSPTFYLNGLTNNSSLTDILYYDSNTSGITFGTKPSSSGSPGGINTYVQYNSGNTFSGSNKFTFDGTNLYLSGMTLSGTSYVVYYDITNGKLTYDVKPSGGVTYHNSLSGLSGGTTDQYYHLTQSDYSNVTGLTSIISNSVSVESSLRTSADSSLAGALSTQTSQGISVEVSLRTSADVSLGTNLSTQTSQGISVEASLRTSADVSLGTAVSNQTSQRISVEASLRTSADSSLATVISNHTHYQLYQPDGNNGFVFTDNGGTLHINGNIVQSGSTYETHAEQLYTTKDYIILRSGATSSLNPGEYAGFEAYKYDGLNNGRLVFDSGGTARVGDVGFEKPLTTRSENPTNGQFAYWETSNTGLSFKQLEITDVNNLSSSLNLKLNISGGTLSGPLTGTTLGLTSQLYLSGVTNNITTEILYYDQNSKKVTFGTVTGIQGATGSQGATGLQGASGATGLQGASGATGSQGVTGTGSQGATGLQGASGATGSQGATGLQGASGATGTQGTTGSQGTIGSQGTTGLGLQGIQGASGETGLQGTNGSQGTTGLGIQGTTGSQGTTGLQGATGSQGIQGTDGLSIQGTQGISIQGVQGTQGVTGGGSGTPGGLNTYVQYNSGNTFSGTSNLTYNGIDLYVSGMTSNITTDVVYYNNNTGQLTHGLAPTSSSASYSGLTYNSISSGSTLQTPGTYTINFTTTDLYSVNISGNTTNSIIFNFSNEIVGKTITMVITNTGFGNFTSCVFDPTSCKTFGDYDSSKTNAISVVCISNTNPKYWVVIANI